MSNSKALGFFIVVALCGLAAGLVVSTPFAPTAQAASFVVNNLGDAADANVGDGICATASSVCTLRAAIEEANANGATADTITLTAWLPFLSSGNTTIAGANQTLTIDGPGVVTTACLYITSAGNIIRGLIIQHCGGSAIYVTGAGNITGGQ